jgi:formylglycine-generating enzyme required for sulfatase activity
MDESPIKVFLSYSRKDDALREEFSAHLSSLTNQNLIEPWHDRKIDAGTEWAKEIDQNLEEAEIIVLLVSADFINSRYCYSNEMKQALAKHAAKTAQVIPVIIRTCDWQSSLLGVLQAIPRDGRAVASGRDQYGRDTPWLQVVQEIGDAAKQIRARRMAEFRMQQQAEAVRRFRSEVEEAYHDGGFSPAAQGFLQKQWQGLGLDAAVAQEILHTIPANLTEYSQILTDELAGRQELQPAQQKYLLKLQKSLEISEAKAEELSQYVLAKPALEQVATVEKSENSPKSPIILSDQQQSAQFLLEDLGNQVSLEMVHIPGGSFLMGSLPGKGEGYERPQHRVTVPGFWMGKYPVTQAQWRSIAALPPEQIELDASPSRFKGDNKPVDQVSWLQAIEFYQRLSKKTGNQYRLPSEAEWEYACRSGTTTDFCFGDTLTPEMANHNGAVGETTAVGIYLPNAFGLYDMHGNVWEWCQDDWHDSYQEAPIDGSVWADDSNPVNFPKILRGGSLFLNPNSCCSAYRGGGNSVNYLDSVGFRVVYAPART